MTMTQRKHRGKTPIFGQVKDVNGDLWDIFEARNTKHGFELYFGHPANDHGAYWGGLPPLIATEALRDFWDANRTVGHGFLFDLPAGRTTLKRVRRRLGFNFLNDATDFWTGRIEDLASLPTREFAIRHGVDVHVTREWRLKIVGKRAREFGWWRTPSICEILLSRLTLSQVGRKLGIGTSHAKRLRDRAKQEQHLSDRREIPPPNTQEQLAVSMTPILPAPIFHT